MLDVAEDILLLEDGLRNKRIIEFMPELLKAIKNNEPLDSESRVLFGVGRGRSVFRMISKTILAG